MANSHRFIHAVMALDAGLHRSRPATARDAFRTFANAVDATLYFLAAALRGSRIDPKTLPDLREVIMRCCRPATRKPNAMPWSILRPTGLRIV